MKVDHDLDLWSNRLSQGLHQAGAMVDGPGRRKDVGIGNEDDLQRPVALRHDLAATVGQRLRVHRLIYRAHVTKAQMGVNRHPVADFATQKTPDRNAKLLAKDVPQRDLDGGNRGGADDAHLPEAVLVHAPDSLFDIARISPDQQRLKIGDGPHDRACLPLQRAFAPAKQPRLVRLDPHEDPVAHFRVHRLSRYPGDLHWPSLRTRRRSLGDCVINMMIHLIDQINSFLPETPLSFGARHPLTFRQGVQGADGHRWAGIHANAGQKIVVQGIGSSNLSRMVQATGIDWNPHSDNAARRYFRPCRTGQRCKAG